MEKYSNLINSKTRFEKNKRTEQYNGKAIKDITRSHCTYKDIFLLSSFPTRVTGEAFAARCLSKITRISTTV